MRVGSHRFKFILDPISRCLHSSVWYSNWRGECALVLFHVVHDVLQLSRIGSECSVLLRERKKVREYFRWQEDALLGLRLQPSYSIYSRDIHDIHACLDLAPLRRLYSLPGTEQPDRCVQMHGHCRSSPPKTIQRTQGKRVRSAACSLTRWRIRGKRRCRRESMVLELEDMQGTEEDASA